MSEYLVDAPPSGWGSWKDCVERSGVRFTPMHLALGEMLVGRSDPPPKGAQVITVDHGGCAATSVGRLLQVRAAYEEPVHPIVLLSVVAGMQWQDDDPRERHSRWTYPMAMSPYLLAAPDGSSFILRVYCNKEGFSADFKDLSRGEDLPRCMHVWGRNQNDTDSARYMFRKEADGLYGQYVSN